MTGLTWHNVERKLGELVPWEFNPRQLRESQAEELEVSLDKFGIVQPFIIGPDNELYDGHQRQSLMLLAGQYGAGTVVPCRQSSRPLTEEERKELVIRLHENVGEWNFDVMANIYDLDDLRIWGFPEYKLAELELPDEWPEYDETAADDVAWIECPDCGHKWPK